MFGDEAIFITKKRKQKMRTSKKRLIEMQKEAMAFLGVKTLAELETHREKANAYFSRKLGKHGLACIQL